MGFYKSCFHKAEMPSGCNIDFADTDANRNEIKKIEVSCQGD